MEFNSVVNGLLRRNSATRRRQLYIRTYTVVPLNEECGLIEWVNNTTGYRSIMTKLYRTRGVGLSNPATARLHSAKGEKRFDVFVNEALPVFKSVFRHWFLNNFPEPSSWFASRLSYCRTTAVISMIGFLVG